MSITTPLPAPVSAKAPSGQSRIWLGMGRGLAGHCPNCGQGKLYRAYLKVKACDVCGHDNTQYPADDAPPYFTILITGHIVIPLMLLLERAQQPSTLVMTAIFVPLTLVLSLGLLRPVKGGTVGLMLTLNMLKTDADEA